MIMQPRLLLFYMGYFLILFARSSLLAYLPLSLLQYVHASFFIVGMNYAIPYIAQLTTMVYFGRLLDKSASWHRYHSLALVGYGALTIQYIFYYIMSQGTPDALMFLLVSITCNLFAAAYIPAVRKFVSAISIVERQGAALSSVGVVESLSAASGGLIGGFLFVFFGINILFIIAALSSLCSVMLLVVTRPFKIVEAIESRVHIDQSYKAVISPRYGISFKDIIAFLVAVSIATGLFFPFFSPYMVSIGGNPALIGTSNAFACGLGAIIYKIIGYLLDHNHPHFVLLYASFGYILVFLLFIIFPNPILAFIAWAIPVYPYFLGANYIVARITPVEQRGRGFSIAALAQTAGVAMGAVMGGTIMSIGVQTTFNSVLILGIGSLLVSLVIFIHARLMLAASDANIGKKNGD
ncbi:MAG TPA: MFS transporter [Candidatus Lokiarchaeia archaeon]|nr:MFS transporter [Candidatus Lokiarchaeia archaeon]